MAPIWVGAQQASGNWANVTGLARGQRVEVVLTSLETVRGTVQSASTDQLTISASGETRALARGSVVRVAVQHSHLSHNVLLGSAVGAGGGVVVGLAVGRPKDIVTRPMAVGIFAPAGALLGALVGLGLPAGADWIELYRAPAAPAAPAAAALVPPSPSAWARVRALPPGQELEVIQSDLTTLRGKLTQVGDDSLELSLAGGSHSIARDRIVRISAHSSHRLRNAGLGGGGGAAAGAIFVGADSSGSRGSDYAGIALIGGAIGAAAGAAFSSDTWREVYRAQAAAPTPHP
ncbi:MAG TPA: hypothetical protein VN690_08845 [Terriglobales bacterium]|nr:hypothetical protein [Terriglobales bacterium]